MRYLFVYMLLPISSVSFSATRYFSFPPIQNTLISYGRFCGAGPDESMWSKYPPLDAFDGLCKQHDVDYEMCYDTLHEELHPPIMIPLFINQIMALRGWIPFFGFLKSILFGKYPGYLRCIHNADRSLIASVKEMLDAQQLPLWWEDTSQAPEVLGWHLYPEACSFGISSLGYCLVTTKDFFRFVIALFQASVDNDFQYLAH